MNELLAFIRQLLPPNWRGAKTVGLVQVLFAPGLTVRLLIDRVRQSLIGRAAGTGQVAALEDVLMRALGSTVYIVDGDRSTTDFQVIVETGRLDALRPVAAPLLRRYVQAGKRYTLAEAPVYAPTTTPDTTPLAWSAGFPQRSATQLTWAVNKAGNYVTVIKKNGVEVLRETRSYQVGVEQDYAIGTVTTDVYVLQVDSLSATLAGSGVRELWAIKAGVDAVSILLEGDTAGAPYTWVLESLDGAGAVVLSRNNTFVYSQAGSTASVSQTVFHYGGLALGLPTNNGSFRLRVTAQVSGATTTIYGEVFTLSGATPSHNFVQGPVDPGTTGVLEALVVQPDGSRNVLVRATGTAAAGGVQIRLTGPNSLDTGWFDLPATDYTDQGVTYTHGGGILSYLNSNGAYLVQARLKTSTAITRSTTFAVGAVVISDAVPVSTILMNPAPGLANLVLTGTDNMKVRDLNTDATYGGFPRRVFADGRYLGRGNVGDIQLAAIGYPQQIAVKTWANNATSNFKDNSIPISHHAIIVVPKGPQHSPHEMPAPATFRPQDGSWLANTHNEMPVFQPLMGKLAGSYHFDREATLDQIYAHSGVNSMIGYTDDGYGGQPGGSVENNHRRHMTSDLGLKGGENGAMNPDGSHARGVLEMSLDDMVDLANAQAEYAIFCLDMETNWGGDITNDNTLVRLYLTFLHWKARFPLMKFCNVYQGTLGSNVFISKGGGAANPLAYLGWLTTENPLLSWVRTFNFPGYSGRGVTYAAKANASMLDLFRVIPLDGYAKNWSLESTTKQEFLMQTYSEIFHAEAAQKWIGSDVELMMFWFGVAEYDSQGLVSQKWPGGRASWINKSSLPVWWLMQQVATGHMEGGGDIQWHDLRPAMNDFTRPPLNLDGSGNTVPVVGATWLPDVPGTPSPWAVIPNVHDTETPFRYPPYPFHPTRYAALVRYRLKDCEQLWNAKANTAVVMSVPTFSMDGGTTWIAERPQNILRIADEGLPIVKLWSSPEGFVIRICEPFADNTTKQRLVKLTPTLTVTITTVGQALAIVPIHSDGTFWYPE